MILERYLPLILSTFAFFISISVAVDMNPVFRKKEKAGLLQRLYKFFLSPFYELCLYILRNLWFITVWVLSTYYVWSNWEEMKQENYYESITGQTLILVLWILLTFLPLIKKVDLNGFQVETTIKRPVFPDLPENIVDESLEEANLEETNLDDTNLEEDSQES